MVTSCCGVCPGTWCLCTAGESLSWRWCHQSGTSPGQSLRPSTLPQEAAREKAGHEELGWDCTCWLPSLRSLVSRFPMKQVVLDYNPSTQEMQPEEEQSELPSENETTWCVCVCVHAPPSFSPPFAGLKLHWSSVFFTLVLPLSS